MSSTMAFNIRQYLGLNGTPGVIPYDHTIDPIPEDLLDRLDIDINTLISYLVGAKKPPRSEPPTVEECQKSLGEFVDTSGLGDFYPPDDPRPEEISKKIVALANDPTAILNSPEQLVERAKVALYDVVIYCDDSSSMGNEGRIKSQEIFASRISKIILPLALEGISIRFINHPIDTYDNVDNVETLKRLIKKVKYEGDTQIGKMMKKKILNPMVIEKSRDGPLKTPLLIIVITDGEPCGESMDNFREVILDCRSELKKTTKGKKAVVYQVNQVGKDPAAGRFIRGLHEDPELKEIMYCTSETLDDKIAELKDNKEGLDLWLCDLLTKFVRRGTGAQKSQKSQKPKKPKKPKTQRTGSDRKEVERKEAERKEMEQKEVERKAAEAERKEAERKEAEQRELERREAERREVERREAERREMERREVERKKAERHETPKFDDID